ncbi:peptidoglycan recognition family protein [Thalassolituus sp. C2-1]|uniref:peptidoglycan recognition protein family protein n=1 Tax=Venatorbacter sp. C2-1 TaxID=2597518 RepID=UPI0011980556|nr:peptidoglycan recognition family protein [Thalassolituus sp. C2-1]TVV42991.1 N-acetylmuramoyl-L-alanine amidase [Thalassolituus sp. C2-1]
MQAVPLELLINGLTVAAGAALLVERFTEILKHVKERANKFFLERDAEAARLAALKTAQQQAAAIQQHLQAGHAPDVAVLKAAAASAESSAAGTDNDTASFEQHTAISVVPIPVISTESAALNLFMRLAPLGLGIILAGIFDLHLLAMFTGQTVTDIPTLWGQGNWHAIILQSLDTLLSGLLIGGGSQPVHVLLLFLTTRRLTDSEKQALQQVVDPGEEAHCQPVPQAPEVAAATNDDRGGSLLAGPDIHYAGGVNPQSLEQVHRRSGDPEQIVVHHTAMNSALGFNAIVDEFIGQKKWLTGYHCVIMPDGSIRPFCRWDRMGNHAKGHNDRTLGIAFHGNFHNQEHDRFANSDGRYGALKPTAAQLDAGARVIALWLNLYPQMSGVLTQAVVPHRALAGADTVCPGNQFPFAELLSRTDAYCSAWQTSAAAQAGLQAFRQKPYIYALSTTSAGGQHGQL